MEPSCGASHWKKPNLDSGWSPAPRGLLAALDLWKPVLLLKSLHGVLGWARWRTQGPVSHLRQLLPLFYVVVKVSQPPFKKAPPWTGAAVTLPLPLPVLPGGRSLHTGLLLSPVASPRRLLHAPDVTSALLSLCCHTAVACPAPTGSGLSHLVRPVPELVQRGRTEHPPPGGDGAVG